MQPPQIWQTSNKAFLSYLPACCHDTRMDHVSAARAGGAAPSRARPCSAALGGTLVSRASLFGDLASLHITRLAPLTPIG